MGAPRMLTDTLAIYTGEETWWMEPIGSDAVEERRHPTASIRHLTRPNYQSDH